MTQDWIEQAREEMREFFKKAKPGDIRALKDTYGYAVYADGPSVREFLYARSDDVDYDLTSPETRVVVFVDIRTTSEPGRQIPIPLHNGNRPRINT